MPEALMPDSMAATLADLNRRLQILEATSRVGLNRVRLASGVGSAAPTSFGATVWEYGSAGNTWVDDLGATGAGYPQITLNCHKVLVAFGARPYGLGSAAGTFRSTSCNSGVHFDGGANAILQGQAINQTAVYVVSPIFKAQVFTVPAGSHTFTLGAQWDDTSPASPIQPLLSDPFIMAIPLDAA